MRADPPHCARSLGNERASGSWYRSVAEQTCGFTMAIHKTEAFAPVTMGHGHHRS
jgi:hypothetical protein